MNSQSVRVRSLSTIATAALSVALLGFAASPAIAADEVDGAVQLSWDGSSYAASTTVSYFGTPVVVPGDSATRTLQVRNDGPTDGYLTAKIVNVDLRTPEAVDTHHNSVHQAPDASGLYGGAGDQGNIYDDILIDWAAASASLSELSLNGTTQFMRVPIARGEVVPVTLTYDFPIASTSGNLANVDLREASFDVELQIGGDASVPPELPETGSSASWAWGAGAVLIAFGGLALLVRRKRSTREQMSV